jgi:hypothetical protein
MQASQPDCFGILWDDTDPQCARCGIKSYCERSTKRRGSGAPPPAEPEPKLSVITTEKELEPASPLDYLLKSIEGRYDREDRIGENAIAHFFRKNGSNIILVTESKVSGRIKVQKKGYERIFDAIESLDHAEEILGIVLS